MIQYNREWGFRTLEKLHYSIYSQSWWDIVSTVTYYLINKDGFTGQVWPYGAAAVINGWAAAGMAHFYSAFIGALGNWQLDTFGYMRLKNYNHLNSTGNISTHRSRFLDVNYNYSAPQK